MITYETRDGLSFFYSFYISNNTVIHMNIQYDCLAELFGTNCIAVDYIAAFFLYNFAVFDTCQGLWTLAIESIVIFLVFIADLLVILQHTLVV